MSKRVLIVDDAVFTRIALRQILEEAGYVVEEVDDGSLAVESYNDFKPHAVIMDITMQTVDGMEAAKMILAIDPEASILMCTALDQKSLVMEAVKVGVKDFLTKPVEPQRLIEGLHNIIGAP